MIVCHVAKIRYPNFHPILLPLPIALLGVTYPNLLHINASVSLAITLTVAVVLYLHFIISIVHELATALQISVFTINKKPHQHHQ